MILFEKSFHSQTKEYFIMKKQYILFILTIFLVTSCEKLEVEYKNKPDIDRVLSEPDDVLQLTSSLFFNWYMTQTSSLSPQMSMWVMSDQGTSSWANSGMYDLSSEPRAEFNNSESYTYAYVFERYWQDLYGVLWQANDILNVTANGMEIGEVDDNGIGKDTKMVRAMSYFIQGVSLGYLGLVYDQAYIMTDGIFSPDEIQLSPYKTVVDSAISSLEKCVNIAGNNSFELPLEWINGSTYSNTELMQLANAFIARLLVYWPRNVIENEQIDWNAVLSHAQNGIQRDLAPYMDNVTWKNWFFHYTVARDNWVRIDARIINMLDPSYPFRYPDDGINPGQASSDDARLESDFNYRSSCDFKPERGYYHFSNYEYKRYPYNHSTPGEVIQFSVVEQDLFIAEAQWHLGNTSAAIDILNAGSRVTRGNLDPIPNNASDEEVLNAIFYERDIDLIMTGFGISFFDMRRRDMLQIGTMLHFPIPAKENNIVGLPVYTFGGVENADGINTSNGGWFPTNNN